jgi:hypothetical protein
MQPIKKQIAKGHQKYSDCGSIKNEPVWAEDGKTGIKNRNTDESY